MAKPWDVFTDAAGNFVDLYLATGAAFRDTLWDIWSEPYSLWDLITSPFGGIQRDVMRRFARTWDAWQELGQDLALVGPRVLRDVVVRLFPVPDEFDQRVMTASEALRWAVQLFIESAIEVEDADLPAEFDIAKITQKALGVREVVVVIEREGIVAGIQAGGALAKRTIAGVVAIVLARLAKHGISLGILIAVGLFVRRMHGPEGKQVLARFALPQDSRRAWSTGRHQSRTNTRKGPDESV
jgi:hypothetical protein